MLDLPANSPEPQSINSLPKDLFVYFVTLFLGLPYAKPCVNTEDGARCLWSAGGARGGSE